MNETRTVSESFKAALEKRIALDRDSMGMQIFPVYNAPLKMQDSFVVDIEVLDALAYDQGVPHYRVSQPVLTDKWGTAKPNPDADLHFCYLLGGILVTCYTSHAGNAAAACKELG